jgi:hypothetical protein
LSVVDVPGLFHSKIAPSYRSSVILTL